MTENAARRRRAVAWSRRARAAARTAENDLWCAIRRVGLNAPEAVAARAVADNMWAEADAACAEVRAATEEALANA